MQRTNKDGKCSKSASKDWPSSADIVVRSSHVGIIFSTKGDVLIKNLFITRSVPTSKVPSCSIMPEKTQGWYLEMGVTSGEPQKKRTFLSGNSQRGNVSCVDVGMETVSRFSLQWHFDPTSRSAPYGFVFAHVFSVAYLFSYLPLMIRLNLVIFLLRLMSAPAASLDRWPKTSKLPSALTKLLKHSFSPQLRRPVCCL